MNTNKDCKGFAYAITTIIVLCFTLLPFSGDIYKDITSESQLAATLEKHNRAYDMSQADMLTVHVDNLTVVEGTMYFAGTEVEIDPSVNAAELVYTKEEIVLRTDNGRVSIIAGDNGQF